jgi:hypothetical protein
LGQPFQPKSRIALRKEPVPRDKTKGDREEPTKDPHEACYLQDRIG